GTTARLHHCTGSGCSKFMDMANRLIQVISADRLGQELTSASQHRPTHIIRLALDTHNNDLDGWILGQYRLSSRDAIHIGHINVHQDDIGLMLSSKRYSLTSATRLRHHLDIFFEKEQLLKLIPRVNDIIYDHDTDCITLGHCGSPLQRDL